MGHSENRKAETGVQYKWRMEPDYSRDLMVYEIWRSTDKVPHTIIIQQFSTFGHAQMFKDLFFSDDWDRERGNDGQVSDDIKFCCELWAELGLKEILGEEFQPKHIAHDSDRYPRVYRNTLENVMSIKYGCGHTEIIDTMDYEHIENAERETTATTVIPLTFNIDETEDEMYKKLMDGIQEGLE